MFERYSNGTGNKMATEMPRIDIGTNFDHL